MCRACRAKKRPLTGWRVEMDNNMANKQRGRAVPVVPEVERYLDTVALYHLETAAQ